MIKRLGIYGGTFDPIHMGHLMVAEMARQDCSLEKVIFIPAGSPPHKNDKYISNPSNRFQMAQLAVKDNPHFEVSDIELKRQGISFTIDTLRALRQIYPIDYEFWMIIGGDTLLELSTWKDSSEIMKMCNFAVYMRTGYSLEGCKAQAEFLNREGMTHIIFIEAPIIDISSTDIRNRVKDGKSIRYLVTGSVRDYIGDKGLYSGG